MNSIDFEFYYMSGKSIDLKHLNLGEVYQPKIKDFIEKKMDISVFSYPFIFNKEMISNKKNSIDDLIKDLGRLGFLIIYNEITSLSNAKKGSIGILDILKESLKLIYQTENVVIAKTISKIIIDNKIIIGDSEFEFLSKLVLEMLRIDQKEIESKIEEEDEKDELMNEFEKRAKAFAKKRGDKNDSFSIMDILNVFVHSQSVIDYNKAFDMTVYQLKNSYETLIRKEMFNINLLHRISPNFKPSEDLKMWEEISSVKKSNLNQLD